MSPIDVLAQNGVVRASEGNVSTANYEIVKGQLRAAVDAICADCQKCIPARGSGGSILKSGVWHMMATNAPRDGQVPAGGHCE